MRSDKQLNAMIEFCKKRMGKAGNARRLNFWMRVALRCIDELFGED